MEFLRFQVSTSHVKENEWSETGEKLLTKKPPEIALVRIIDWQAANHGSLFLKLPTATLTERAWQAKSTYQEGVERQQSVGSAHKWMMSVAISLINTLEQI